MKWGGTSVCKLCGKEFHRDGFKTSQGRLIGKLKEEHLRQYHKMTELVFGDWTYSRYFWNKREVLVYY